jgi:hypothetical protein
MRISSLLKRMAAVKLPTSLKNKIAKDFKKAGLDGNGRFQKPQHGTAKAIEILNSHGIELDDVPSADYFRNKESGRFNWHLAFKNKEDPFSPESISNSMLSVSYYQIAPNKYEVLVYLS